MSAQAQQLAAELRDIRVGPLRAGDRLSKEWLEAIAEHLVDERGWIPPEHYANLELAVMTLESAIDRVRALHAQDESLLARGTWCPADGQPEPCKTLQALNGSPPR